VGKLWWLFLLLSLACALLNPYVGFFGLFVWVDLFISFCFVMNIKPRISRYAFHVAEKGPEEYSALLRRAASGLVNVWRVISILFFIIWAVVCSGIWLLASGQASALVGPTNMAPFSLFAPELKTMASVVLCAASIVFCLLGAISIFIRCGQFARQLKRTQAAP
jgi:hypothetical protein